MVYMSINGFGDDETGQAVCRLPLTTTVEQSASLRASPSPGSAERPGLYSLSQRGRQQNIALEE